MRWVLVLILLFLCYLSTRRRLHIKKRALRTESVGTQDVQPASSPLADSLKELVGLAGGIYIAMSALGAFLKISVPAQVSITGVSFDPIAALSILMSIIQPYFHPLKKK